MTPTIVWQDDHLRLLDQTRLPTEVVYLECRTVQQVWDAIKCLAVRGAPAIGIAAAYGVCLAREEYLAACDHLATSRPTAVNLFWALDQMRRAITAHHDGDLHAALVAEAVAIHNQDRDLCAAMGRIGADLLDPLGTGMGLLTHCNTGALATGGDGTALAVIFELARRGHSPRVFADETRPLLQGARLTMWELMQRDIDATLICDNMAAQVMREGRVQAVLVGADRITARGDAANKIGTYGVAVLARAHQIPFYVVAPSTTFDLSIIAGSEIPIEQRAAGEITAAFGKRTAPEGAKVYNPAFDYTPAELITGLITERGVIAPVDEAHVRKVLGS